MEIHEVRYFLAVARTRNFTKAAELCNVTQPALTRAIQKLEDEMGGLLFSRERGNVRLTDLGRLLEPELGEMIERGNRARLVASRFLRLEDAQINLGVMCTIGPLRFAGFLNWFRAMHPGIELTLIEGVPARLTELVEQGELDIAIVARPEGFNEPLRATPLYTERFNIGCAHTHDFAQRHGIALADMEGQIYLQRINCEYRDHLADLLAARGVKIMRSYRSEREDWIQVMVAGGMGVCFLPEFSATCPGLVTRPLTDPLVTREVSFVTMAGRRWSSPVAALVSAMQKYAWPGGPPDRQGRARTEDDAESPDAASWRCTFDIVSTPKRQFRAAPCRVIDPPRRDDDARLTIAKDHPIFMKTTVTAALLALPFAFALGAPAAQAGGCPADKIVASGAGQPRNDTPANGVTDTVIVSTDLAKEPAAIQGRLFRLRKLVIQPGGVVPWHSHENRPAIIYIIGGDVVEYASDCSVPIVHHACDSTAETHTTAHWWKNTGRKTVVLLSADLFPVNGDEHMM